MLSMWMMALVDITVAITCIDYIYVNKKIAQALLY